MAYRVPYVNYPRQYKNMKGELDAAIKEVLTGGDFILRRQLKQFEDNMAAYLGVAYAIGLNSGTDALHLSLLAADIKTGDQVITVAHTFLATVGTIVHCGAEPVLVDVGRDYNMDMSLVEAAITARTRAIIPVHLNGRLCNMKKLMSIAKKHNLLVIEDAAQAVGATFNGRRAGSFGLTGCFSFYPAKVLGGAGDGGMVVTNNSEAAAKLRTLRDNGRIMGQDEVACYGYNSRLDNLQAAILDVKLRYLTGWLERRRQIATIYHEGLAGLPGLKLPLPPRTDSLYFDVFQNYCIRSHRRDQLVDYLRQSGVEIIISWPIPMHRQPALALGHFQLPETEAISREVLSLPLYPELTDEQVDYVIDTIKGFFK